MLNEATQPLSNVTSSVYPLPLAVFSNRNLNSLASLGLKRRLTGVHPDEMLTEGGAAPTFQISELSSLTALRLSPKDQLRSICVIVMVAAGPLVSVHSASFPLVKNPESATPVQFGVGVDDGVRLGVGVEVDVAVLVGVGVLVDVAVLVAVGVLVDVAVLVGVGVFVGVCVGVMEAVGVLLGVEVGAAVGTSVVVEVRVGNGKGVAVRVAVPVTVNSGVTVGVGGAVGVPVGSPGFGVTVGTGLFRLSLTSVARAPASSSSGSRSRITASTMLMLRLLNRPVISSAP